MYLLFLMNVLPACPCCSHVTCNLQKNRRITTQNWCMLVIKKKQKKQQFIHSNSFFFIYWRIPFSGSFRTLRLFGRLIVGAFIFPINPNIIVFACASWSPVHWSEQLCVQPLQNRNGNITLISTTALSAIYKPKKTEFPGQGRNFRSWRRRSKWFF